jgi:glycosyltransferase involved in cell wall biosynthesis
MKEKKLLIVSTHFPPDARPGTHRVIRFAKYLSQLGWSIHVLTPRTDAALYKQLRDASLIKKIPSSVKVYSTNALRLCWPFTGFNSYLVPDKEAGWIPFACNKGLKIIREHDISVLYSTAPPWTTHVTCWWLKKKTGVKWVADIRDPWTRRPWMPIENRGGVKYSVLKKIERTVVNSADRVILNTSHLQKDFCAYYRNVDPEKFLTIPNGIDADDFLGLDAAKNSVGRFVVTHGGSLYRKRDPRPFLQALGELVRDKAIAESDLLVRFLGSVDAKFDMYGWVREHKLESMVTIEPPIAHDQYLKALSSSDVLLLIQPDTDLQVPSKLFEYMAIGKPVLALADRGATSDIVQDYGNGMVVKPNDVIAIKKAIIRLLKPERPAETNDVSHGERIVKWSAAATSQKLDSVLQEYLAT